MRSNSSGVSIASTVCSNQAVTPGTSISSVASSLMAGKPIHQALVVDFGGVLTTSIWPAFAAFCDRVGLAPETVRELFRGDEEALKLLRGLETGALPEPEFERQFAELLGLDSHEGLIGDMFADLGPDDAM